MSFQLASWRHYFRSRPGFALVLAVAFLTAIATQILPIAVGSQEGNIFWEEFRKGDGFLGWVSFLLVLSAPLFLRFCQRLRWRALGSWLENNVALVVGANLLFYAALMHWGALRVAFTPDEACAVLQARTFGAFHLTPQVAPDLARLVVPAWIQDDFVIFSARTGQFTPTYWPGYALIMAPFAHFGLEWLCNPVLTALSLVVLFRLARRLTGSGEGGVWALVIALSSPQIALNAATYFAMPAHLLFNLLFCTLIVRDTRRAAFGAGLLGGFALILHNPVPHFSFALPWIIWVACKRRSHLAPLLAGYALIFLPLGLGWSTHLQSFDAGRYIKAATPGTHTGVVQKFAEVLSRVAYVIRLPDTYLWLSRAAGICKFVIWATPGTAGLAILGWLWIRNQRKSERQSAATSVHNASALPVENTPNTDFLWLFGVSLTVNFVIYLFIRFDQGHGWGFRYLHQSWMVLALLPASFLIRANAKWKRLAALMCLSATMVMLPLRALELRVFMNDLLFEGPPPPPSSPSITFVREREQGVVFIQNDPFLRDPHWSLLFKSPAHNASIAQHYLTNPHKIQSGKWGETWTGSNFLRPGSP